MTQQPPSTPEAAPRSTVKVRRRAQAGTPAQLIPQAIAQSFVKLNPRTLAHNPVMFVVEIGSVICTLLLPSQSVSRTDTRRRF